jgi:ABC-type bacteriocin/lantibiotic exporter with double-glycine peptidase domain
MVDGCPVKRRYLIPEVIQTSATDCGSAALKAIAAGFGIYLSYGRLREACQTDVDGTSIDTLEELAGSLGLEAAQSVVPADLVLLTENGYLPAIMVTRLPDGATHFVVVWRVLGQWVQIMDPGAGRLWVNRRALLATLYIHEMPVPRSAWEAWTQSDVFGAGIGSRRRTLQLPVQVLLWASPAHEDAAMRLAGRLQQARQLEGRTDTVRLMTLCAHAPNDIPALDWSAVPIENDNEQVMLRGAVLLSVKGIQKNWLLSGEQELPAALTRICNEPPPNAWASVWAALRQDNQAWLLAVALAVTLSAIGTVLEALLIRFFFDISRYLNVSAQRAVALAALLIFLALLLIVDWASVWSQLRAGRHLEWRLRVQFFAKIPLLGDRYFQSRLISDMAYRAHSLQLLRQLPEIAGQLSRLLMMQLVTACAMTWMFPGAGLWAWSMVVLALGIPLLFFPAMTERDLRCRETSGSLSRFYLDAMWATMPLRAHGAQRTMRTVQLKQLNLWAEASLRRQSLIALAEVVQMASVMALVIGLVMHHVRTVGNPVGLLLLVYWAVSVPLLGREWALLLWNLPAERNTLLRFLEPMGAPEETAAQAVDGNSPTHGVVLDFCDAGVAVSGHSVLNGINLQIQSGEHVAIVGASGAGKSSLLGLLLGWYECHSGSVLVDGVPLDASTCARLRRQIAWIDPQVHLFSGSLLTNVCYGNDDESTAQTRSSHALEQAGLQPVLAHLPQGLQTQLGDAGSFLSGGQGQAVRVARAMTRADVRLALLDEAARGLDKSARQRLLRNLRQHFSGATMLCVSHDISETRAFDRVVVMDQGRVMEYGPPAELERNTLSRYRHLLEQEREVAQRLWAHEAWRHVVLRDGQLHEDVVQPEAGT